MINIDKHLIMLYSEIFDCDRALPLWYTVNPCYLFASKVVVTSEILRLLNYATLDIDLKGLTLDPSLEI